MSTIGNTLAVIFNGDHNTLFDIGGIQLERAKSWEHKAGTESEHKLTAGNVNKIMVNPQMAIVFESNDPFFKVGDKVFTHYLAYESADFIQLEKEVAIIDKDLVIFK